MRFIWALVLPGFMLAGNTLALDFKAVVGKDGQCPSGYVLATPDDARANQQQACQVLGAWYIVRLAGGGSMDGPGYNCKIRDKDERALGGSLCKKAESTGGLVALGCFRDRGDPGGTKGRDLDGIFWSDSQMTTEKCVQRCESGGYKYAGTQYSSQCFCGNSYGRYGKASNCNMPCKGDANQKCGGTWANLVYQIAKPQCFWMENYSGKFKWVPASTVYHKALTKQECFRLDSCDGGQGLSGGGCYKWATSPDAPRMKW
jgi:hypothetical protein